MQLSSSEDAEDIKKLKAAFVDQSALDRFGLWGQVECLRKEKETQQLDSLRWHRKQSRTNTESTPTVGPSSARADAGATNGTSSEPTPNPFQSAAAGASQSAMHSSTRLSSNPGNPALESCVSIQVLPNGSKVIEVSVMSLKLSAINIYDKGFDDEGEEDDGDLLCTRMDKRSPTVLQVGIIKV